MQIKITPETWGCFSNPLYSPELKEYYSRQWWGYIVLWGNLLRPIAERQRRTTATIEVHHKILKTYGIPKRNLPLDEYLYARVHVIRQNQILISEKFLFIGPKRAVVSKLEEDDSEKWSKSVIKLTKSQKSLLQEFKEYFEERKKENHSSSQGSCAAEIQSVVSKMLKGQYMPKEGEKTVRY